MFVINLKSHANQCRIRAEAYMNINRNYKDSVFTALFSDPDLLRELYSALNGISLPRDVQVSINTLENILYMDMYNDISFEIGGKLVVLIEHQSSINPNMALRLLFYIARVLEKTVIGRSLYSERSLLIPWPEFYVLYNGAKPYPDEKVIKLSDLFDRPHDLHLSGKLILLLELEVKVININEGRNKAIINRCRKLAEYSSFIARVRSFLEEGLGLEEAMKKAVKFCRKHDILKQFLETNASEVLDMLLAEWNLEDAKKVWYEDGQEDGREEEKLQIARNALDKGSSPEFVHEITGLNMETILGLKR